MILCFIDFTVPYEYCEIIFTPPEKSLHNPKWRVFHVFTPPSAEGGGDSPLIYTPRGRSNVSTLKNPTGETLKRLYNIAQ
jgi:hypothetical protein